MSRDMSPEDVKQHYITGLGADLGAYFHELYVEVAWLQDKWREFRELYGASSERIDVLNEAASHFFGIVHGVLWEDTLLHLGRLTDAPEMGKKKNLSLRGLPVLIVDEAFRVEISSLVELAVAKCAFARDWRNRYIGHRDLSHALDETAAPLAHASRLSVQEALDAVSAVIERVHEKFLGGGIDLRVPGTFGDALDLIRVLQEGLATQRAREERLRAGTYLLEDLVPRPPI